MAFTAVSTGQAVKAVLFDVFGTVVDWRTGVAAAVGRFAGEHGLDLDAGAFADAWRSRYVPAMGPVRIVHYRTRRPLVTRGAGNFVPSHALG